MLTEIQLMEMHDNVALGAAIDEFDFARKQTTDEDVADRGEGAEGRVYLYRGAVLSGDRPAYLSALGAGLCSRSQGTAHAMPQTLASKIQALRVGPAGFAALPGEIFVEIGLAVKAGSPFAPQFVMSLANDYLGYVATDEQLALGAYETWPSRSAIGGPGHWPGFGDHGSCAA